MSDLTPTQEVRFAVVMYGGVSLAIYMNGVAQEMLNLVRATAPEEQDSSRASSNVDSTALVYRKLGQMLEYGQEPKPLGDDENRAICTRFTIDVISGTSAGGINGVFLAKALANNQQMKKLKTLWIEEGDFGKLMNDKKKYRLLGQKAQSLLDGKYMYGKLLDALDGMEEPNSMDSDADQYTRSTCVEELDLFVTSTDISGLLLPIRLANGVVNERRHRNVFHFVYSSGKVRSDKRNDFSRRFNPFLAFASRCTSSFPVAFEPMKLKDIDDVVRRSHFFKMVHKKTDEKSTYMSDDPTWRRFYVDYIAERALKSAEENAVDFLKRSFGDGGYLDNKPFSYATDAMLRRSAELPVHRKLVFVDPDPQNPSKEPDFDGDIDVLQNTMSALAPTSSTETIREDIQRIMERNSVIERLNHVIKDVDRDVNDWEEFRRRQEQTEPTLERDDWVKMGLDEMIKRRGISYGGYHRLKVAALTSELAKVVVDALNMEPDSDEFTAIRELIRAWRDKRYAEREIKDGVPSQNKFVMDFDISYRLRRLSFVRAKINELSCLNGEKLIAALKKGRAPANLLPDIEHVTEFRAKLQPILRKMHKELNEIYIALLQTQSKYHRRRNGEEQQSSTKDKKRGAQRENNKHTLRDHCLGAGIGPRELKKILDKPAGEKREEFCKEFLDTHPKSMAAFDEIAKLITDDFSEATKDASRLCEALLDTKDNEQLNDVALTARTILWNYYRNYENYDMVTFPVMYQAGIGEMDIIEIIRISPYDAESLIKLEDEEHKGESGRRKLGGATYGHFGAFLEQTWRENDIMWGRLDAAELIINTLLPVADKNSPLNDERKRLIKEAQKAIIKEEMVCWGEEELRKKVVSELIDRSSSLNAKTKLKKMLKQLEQSHANNATLKKVLDSCLNEEELLDYLTTEYEVSRYPDPEVMVELLARSTRIIGKMLEGVAEKHHINSKRVAWVTRLGQLFWGLVEVAVPGSFWNLFFRHWIKLLYAFEAFLIVGGVLLPDSGMESFGLVALAVTGTTQAFVKLLGDYMRTGRFKLLRSVSGLLLILLASVFVVSAMLGFGELLKMAHLNEQAANLPLISRILNEPLAQQLGGVAPRWRALIMILMAALLIILCTLLIRLSSLFVKTIVRAASSLLDKLAGGFA